MISKDDRLYHKIYAVALMFHEHYTWSRLSTIAYCEIAYKIFDGTKEKEMWDM